MTMENAPVTSDAPYAHIDHQDRAATGMSPAVVLLFALAGGIAVGNLYWAQPLLTVIAGDLGVREGAAGLLVTVTQIGYALGVLLVVPLGDVLDRRRLIPAMMFGSAATLVASAVAPSFALLSASLVAVGLTTVTGQLLVPFAGDIVRAEHRGRVVGTIVSGLLTGILLSRTISGLVAELFGWRAIFWLAAAMTFAVAVVLRRALPADLPRQSIPYRSLLASVFFAVGRHRAVQATLALGASAFCVFTMFWTGLTFLLSAPPFGYPLGQIGLVGLVGLAGALAARRVGALHDRGWSVRTTGAALVLALASLALALAGARSIVAILAAVLLLDIAIQAVNVLNQTRLLAVDPAARSRLNTAFVAGNFMGGAIGSALAGALWAAGGWLALMEGAGAIILVALVVFVCSRRVLDVR